MREMAGKGWRVLGYLIWMLGAGVVLDSTAWRLGGLLLVCGGGLFALGVAQSIAGGVPAESAGDDLAAIDRATVEERRS